MGGTRLDCGPKRSDTHSEDPSSSFHSFSLIYREATKKISKRSLGGGIPRTRTKDGRTPSVARVILYDDDDEHLLASLTSLTLHCTLPSVRCRAASGDDRAQFDGTMASLPAA